jgi:hypothetical protein
MRRALNIALVIFGISASVMASPRTSTSPNNSANSPEVPSLHVSMPADMKDFPIEAIPLP